MQVVGLGRRLGEFSVVAGFEVIQKDVSSLHVRDVS